VESYRDDEQYKGKEDNKIASSLKVKANQLRGKGIPMKYHEGKMTTGITTVKADDAISFLNSLGISEDKLKEAKQARTKAQSVVAGKLGTSTTKKKTVRK